jgi:hypothetical protein
MPKMITHEKGGEKRHRHGYIVYRMRNPQLATFARIFTASTLLWTRCSLRPSDLRAGRIIGRPGSTTRVASYTNGTGAFLGPGISTTSENTPAYSKSK